MFPLWLQIAIVVVLVDVAGLLFVGLVAFVSGQDVVNVVPKILDGLSWMLSSRVRMEQILLSKSRLEERVIIELINHAGTKRVGKTLTVCFTPYLLA